MARGAAAGAFAAMLPAFGLHLILAVAAAFLVRGARVAAVAACLLLGNPLTHLLIVPLSYEVGHALIPRPPAPQRFWLPEWARAALPVAERTAAGGLLLGLVVAPPVFFVVRFAVRRRAATRSGAEVSPTHQPP